MVDALSAVYLKTTLMHTKGAEKRPPRIAYAQRANGSRI
jgi:hypothetical protein